MAGGNASVRRRDGGGDLGPTPSYELEADTGGWDSGEFVVDLPTGATGRCGGDLGECYDQAGGHPDPEDSGTWTRRDFMAGVGTGATLAATPFAAPAADRPTAAARPAGPPGDTPLSLTVNGDRVSIKVDSRSSLLDTLREYMHLTGTKKGCDHGQCGACTVLVEGRRVLSCLSLAQSVDGLTVTTVEGLADGEKLHPLQEAFLEYDAFQCGYCTPGQLCSAAGLLAEGRCKTDDDIREQMSGNICRCGAYPNIVAAVRSVLQNTSADPKNGNGAGKGA